MFKFLVPASLAVLLVEMLMIGPRLVESDIEGNLGGTMPVPTSVDGLSLAPVLVVDGLEEPTDVVGDPLSDRLFVVEKAGRVRIVDEGRIIEDPFVDLRDWVESTGNEQGMLSMRFHPEFADNGRVFFFFTDSAGTSQLVAARVAVGNRDVVDSVTLERILSIPQYGQYHQSGSMFFGPDGYLWVSLGDGGGIGDPQGHGQDVNDINATVIRIDVDNGEPYAIPDDNPFVGEEGRAEIWAYGLRNPWRITYDATTGLVYIPDVGQEGSEELNVVDVHDGGHNFGWSVSEGSVCYDADTCDMSGHTMPVYQYLHDGNGCAIIGGGVYRGELMPEIQGHYFFADFCVGWVRSVVLDHLDTYLVVDWTPDREDRLGNISTIGFDRHGEMYVANLQGEIYRLELNRQ